MKIKLPVLLLLVAIGSISQASYGDESIRWLRDIEQAKDIARRENKTVLVHFWSESCGPCLALERYVFPHPDVAKTINQSFVPVKVNTSQNPRIAATYKVSRIPQDVFITPEGAVVRQGISPSKTNQYIEVMNQVAAMPPATVDSSVASAISQRFGGSQGDVPVVSAKTRSQFEQMSSSPVPGASYALNDGGPQPASYNGSQSISNPNFSDQGRTETPAAATSQFNPNASIAQTQSNAQVTTNPLVGGGFTPPRATDATQLPTQPPIGGAFDPRKRVSPPVAPQQMQTSVAPANPGVAPSANPNPAQFASANARPPAATSPVAPASTNSQQPAEAAKSDRPPVGLEGYCPVTLIKTKTWRKGSAEHGAIHRGRLYFFTTSVDKSQFMANPDRFAPVLSGFDPVVFAEKGEFIGGERQHGVFFNNQIYLFSNEESLKKFWDSRREYATVAFQAMQQADTQNVRR